MDGLQAYDADNVLRCAMPLAMPILGPLCLSALLGTPEPVVNSNVRATDAWKSILA